jgi:hypothetical protein
MSEEQAKYGALPEEVSKTAEGLNPERKPEDREQKNEHRDDEDDD